MAGSAGIESSTDLVSTATTPVGIPPSLWRERPFSTDNYKISGLHYWQWIFFFILITRLLDPLTLISTLPSDVRERNGRAEEPELSNEKFLVPQSHC